MEIQTRQRPDDDPATVMRNNTDVILSLVDDNLPDDADLDAEALLVTLYSATTEFESRMISWAINNVCYCQMNDEFKGDNLWFNPLDESVDVLVPSEDDLGVATPNEEITDIIPLKNAFRASWDMSLDHSNRPLIDLYPSFTLKDERGAAKELLNAYGFNHNDNTDGFDRARFDPEVQKQCFVSLLLLLYHEFEQANVTAREYLSYHLETRFTAEKSAAIATQLVGSEQSAGAIRSNVSRVKEKYETAEATINAIGGGESPPRVPPQEKQTQQSGSGLITEDIKAEIRHFVQGVIQTQSNAPNASEDKKWALDEGISLVIEVALGSGAQDVRIESSFYCETDRLPEPVHVDENDLPDDETPMVAHRTGDQELTMFGSVFSFLAETEVLEAINRGTTMTAVELSSDFIDERTGMLSLTHSPSFRSTNAFEIDDADGSRSVVKFVATLEGETTR